MIIGMSATMIPTSNITGSNTMRIRALPAVHVPIRRYERTLPIVFEEQSIRKRENGQDFVLAYYLNQAIFLYRCESLKINSGS